MSPRTIICKNAPEFGLPGKTFTLPRFFLFKGFSKAAHAEQGSCLGLNPLSFSLCYPSSFFSLPFFVCSRGVKDKGVFNSQRLYLRMCHSQETCPFSWGGVICTFNTPYWFVSSVSLKHLQRIGFLKTHLSPAEGVHMRCCLRLRAGEHVFHSSCCANRVCRNAIEPFWRNHTRQIYVCHLIVVHTHTHTHIQTHTTDTGFM